MGYTKINKIKEFAKGRWLEVHLLYIYFRVESPDNSKIPPLISPSVEFSLLVPKG